MGYFWDVGMSVINQMLKDLDKRQGDQQGVVNSAVPVLTKNSNTKLTLVIVVIIIIVNIVGIFGWQLYSENQQLRYQSPMTLENERTTSNNKINEVFTSKVVVAQSPMRPAVSKAIKPAIEETNDLAKLPPSSEPSSSEKNNNTLASSLNKESKSLPAQVAEKSDVVVTPVVQVPKKFTKPEAVKETVTAKSSLTISRTQLSPQALAANKISEAEQAIERNDIAKAESLFEEVLLVMPEHETARKQLAALWYGKKYYQNAVNLLSQGIALAPKAEEMRLMSARIYYEQGQARQAYNILSPVKRSNSTEIQTLLANASAELNEHNSAIVAYRKLITLEPNVGRWWLGVAVSLDSLGNFVPARDAYKQAIARNNLSTSAMQFARQRLIELGE
jgi:MSHA biogenesis protein MshN